LSAGVHDADGADYQPGAESDLYGLVHLRPADAFITAPTP
jgi:hypothetical protein